VANLTEKTKLIALAHLKVGKKPKEVADLLDMSYAQALKLNKELAKAEQQDNLQELFNLDEAALETLFEKVQTELTEPMQALTGEVLSVDESISQLSKSVEGLGILEKEMQDAAIVLVKKITVQATTSTTTDTILVLAEALAKLQGAFFAKGTNVQVNNINGSFEKYLRD